MMEINEQNFFLKDLFVATPINVSEYYKGCFRSWHFDGGYTDPYFQKRFTESDIIHFMARKLTGVVQLSKPTDYKGGDLELMFSQNPAKDSCLREQGTLIVFPSDFWHRITRVKSGYRYSAVMFLYGDSF